MNDFDYECSARKSLARQAKYRKNGSKSKKCSLPSDNLTQKQWKERNGPVMSYNLSAPMDWGTFKAMPLNLQAEYISNLQKKYGATASDMAAMFGVKPTTIFHHAEKNGLGVAFSRGHRMKASQRAAWSEFIGDEISTETEALVISEAAPRTEPVTQSSPAAMSMTQVSLRFDGAIDVNMVANSLRMILGEHPTGELEVICSLS